MLGFFGWTFFWLISDNFEPESADLGSKSSISGPESAIWGLKCLKSGDLGGGGVNWTLQGYPLDLWANLFNILVFAQPFLVIYW